MNLLREYIREIISALPLRSGLREAVVTGRKLDRYSTVIKRHVMRAIKDPDVREYFKDNSQVHLRLDDVSELKEVEYLRHVIINMVHGDQEYPVTHAAYEFDLEATPEQRKDSDLKVEIILPRDFSDRMLGLIDEELTDALRHELEHSGQETWELMDCQKKTPSEDQIWKSLKNAAEYYTCPAEVKAHVAGFMKRAKNRKEPLFDVIDAELDYIYQTGIRSGFSDGDLRELVSSIRKSYRHYAEERYPGLRERVAEQRLFLGDKDVEVELASTPQGRTVGLKYRDSLSPDSGMLFVFPDSTERSFYMKDTKIPLSIAYADPDGTINTIKDMFPFDETSVTSDHPSTFALEMNRGWFDENGITLGDKIKRRK